MRARECEKVGKREETEVTLPCFWPFTIGGIVELKLSWLCREKEQILIIPAQSIKVCSKAEFAEKEEWHYYGHYMVYRPTPHRTAFSPPLLVPTETIHQLQTQYIHARAAS